MKNFKSFFKRRFLKFKFSKDYLLYKKPNSLEELFDLNNMEIILWYTLLCSYLYRLNDITLIIYSDIVVISHKKYIDSETPNQIQAAEEYPESPE